MNKVLIQYYSKTAWVFCNQQLTIFTYKNNQDKFSAFQNVEGKHLLCIIIFIILKSNKKKFRLSKFSFENNEFFISQKLI